MIKDINIFLKHNLDTSSIKNVAIELANRLDLNIIYGFIDSSTFWKYDESKYKYGFNIEGQIKVNDSDEFVTLTIEDYLQKKLYQEVGNEIFECKEIWESKDVAFPLSEVFKQKFIEDYILKVDCPFEFNLLYEDYDIDTPSVYLPIKDFYSISIQKDYLSFRLNLIDNWEIISILLSNDNELDAGLDKLKKFRNCYREKALILSDADTCYYTSQWGLMYVFDNFKDFENNLKKSTNNLIYTFSELFTNNESFLEFQKNINNGILPDVYIDDFKDLEKSTRF